MQAEHLTIDDILYSPVREHTSGRTLDHVAIDNKPELDRPFADAPAERSNAACEALMSAPPTATDWLNSQLSQTQNAQSQIWQQQALQQNYQGLLAQSAVAGATPVQQQALQQSLQQAIGYQQQNLQQYFNTSASNAINPYMQIGGLSGALSGSANTSSLCSPTAVSAERCPVTGRNTISEAEAVRQIGVMLGGTFG